MRFPSLEDAAAVSTDVTVDIERVGALTNRVRKTARTGGREWNA
jgi:hypothetical protein